ncbi:porin [Caballeronia cordobensis]|uniref:Porin n=1 Tax=Caballeronia cordobensis TaxID=1353886 RepID=A0A158HK59_CABCO|nr:porin [Caballeronia cordobensis]SAL44351.1 porin [Caballeronia cordobensis]
MKKNIPLAAALLAFGATTAHAQSSVTLYGVIDEGFNAISNSGGHRLYNMTSAVVSGWGVTGAEDLGGGYKAIFKLESGFELNNGTLGQGGLMFGRTAYVGMSSPYGTAMLGRQYDLVEDYVAPFAALSVFGVYTMGHPGGVDDINHTNRINNVLRYETPDLRGFRFGAMYSLGGVAGSFSQNSVIGAAGSYVRGPFSAAVAYLRAKDPNYSVWGSVGDSGSKSPATGGFFVSPVYSGYASANAYQVIALGSAYQIGPVTLGAVYTNTRFEDIGTLNTGKLNLYNYHGDARFDSAELNVRYLATPSLSFGAAYNYTWSDGPRADIGAHYHQVSLMSAYQFSKRTSVYLGVVYQRAGGTDSTGKAASASIIGLTASSSDTQTAVRAGLRVRF